jgi:hypothetical protein
MPTKHRVWSILLAACGFFLGGATAGLLLLHPLQPVGPTDCCDDRLTWPDIGILVAMMVVTLIAAVVVDHVDTAGYRAPEPNGGRSRGAMLARGGARLMFALAAVFVAGFLTLSTGASLLGHVVLYSPLNGAPVGVFGHLVALALLYVVVRSAQQDRCPHPDGEPRALMAGEPLLRR